MKRAFGFSSDPIDETEFEETSENTQKGKQDSENISIVNDQDEMDDEQQSQKIRTEIFEGVVELFNKSLPDFLKSSLDVEAQRKYIYDSLDQSLKDYIVKMGTSARRQYELKWSKERVQMQNELATLKAQAKEIEESKAEWKRQQLSADRQKRALSDRLHDLENQVASLEAEKEQYDLENKSLINKLKVSGVKEGELEDMRQEVARLQSELLKARTSQGDEATTEIITQKDEQIKELQDKIADLNAIENSKSAEAEQELNAQIEALIAENTKLNEAIDQLKAKEEIADAMINDLTAKASDALKKLEECEATLSAKIEVADNEALESSFNELKEKYSLLQQELETSNAELSQAQEELKVVEEIQAEMEKFEEIKKKKDERIADLQDENNRQATQVAQMQEEIESLRKTIEANIYNQAESENQLRQEIERLKANSDDFAKKAESKEEEKISKRKCKIKISAIDESVASDTIWLEATPPKGTATRPTPPDIEFGYVAPVKKNTPENDAQMSLDFD